MRRGSGGAEFFTRRDPGDLAVVLDRPAPVPGLVLPYLDRIEATRVLTGRGLSGRLIAERLNCTPRTVVRYRNLLRNGSG